MRSKLLLILIANLGVCSAMAADDEGGFRYFGSLGLGYRWTNESSGTRDAAKLNEYQDISSAPIGIVDLHGRGNQYYLDAFAEELGRDDQYIDLKGGKYRNFKYEFWDNRIPHNWTFGALTPYSGAGGAVLTSAFPNLNTNNWASYDLGQQRDNFGGLFEISNNSPWYVRAEANQVTQTGLKLIAGSEGFSPGQGFIDKPFPIDFKTQNASLEGGYSSKQGQLSANVLYSKFTNNQQQLLWTNPNFGSQLDTTTLPNDSDYLKFSANGSLKQLPFDSTLAGRVTYSKTTNNLNLPATALATTGGVFQSTNPDQSIWNGDVLHETASLSLFSNPSKQVDTRLYWNWFEKSNRSDTITFTPPTGSSLLCSNAPCTNEVLNYRTNDFGADVGYRINGSNRVVVGLQYVDTDTNRFDYNQIKDTIARIEWRNTSLENLASRLKYQYTKQRSTFLLGDAGTGPSDPAYLERYIARFDYASFDQNLVKLGLDAQITDMWDAGFEGIYKQTVYTDTVLGRNRDTRQQFYFSVGYGSLQTFRVMAFADIEWIQYQSYLRTITTTPPTDPNAYNPFAPPFTPVGSLNSTNYNWGSKNQDRNWAVGIGADWAATERLTFKTSLIWEYTNGSVDFAVQQGANPAVPSVPISSYDNTRQWYFNVKGTYKVNTKWDVTGGYAYQSYTFSDIGYNNYQYTITNPAASSPQASYLSGAYAFPNYIANIFYVVATYKFQ